MYGCPSWKSIYRKSVLMVRYWMDTWTMFFKGRLGNVWYAPWIPVVEVILLSYILIGIPTLAILVGSLVLSAIIFALIRVSISRLSHSLWVDWERYLRCSKPIVLLSEKIDRVVGAFRNGFVDEGCMGLGVILMIYISVLIGLLYIMMYPQISLMYTIVMVIGMFISLSLGF